MTDSIALRTYLAGAAQQSPETINGKLHQLAHLDGQLSVVVTDEETARAAAERFPDDPCRQQVRRLSGLLRQLVTGPDDTWSGRNNELRRVRYEGKLEAARELLDAIAIQTVTGG
jgi:ATP/maltotriose-dependent transcriptional regulator MalT